ncbi:MAG: hypothetical protein Q9218_005905 [Villophora microphyllina]
MAEFAVVSSIIQIADVGLRLSLKLYTISETIARADKTILSISKDVSLTASVLHELGTHLEKDKEVKICSENAVKTAEQIVQECLKVFHEIEGLLEKHTTKTATEGKSKHRWTESIAGRMKWPFLQPKMQLLMSNLDRLKATMMLMLNVIAYAKHLREQTQANSQLEDHRKTIEDLARSKDEYTRKFKTLTEAIMTSSSDQKPPTISPLKRSADIMDDVQQIPTSFPQDKHSRTVSELKIYGDLINILLKSINAVEDSLEPFLGARFRSNITITHRQEAKRLEILHGRHSLQATLTGAAWDVIQVACSADADLPSASETCNLQPHCSLADVRREAVVRIPVALTSIQYCRHPASSNQTEDRKHLLQHEKPYKCDVRGCTKDTGFSTQNDLDRHKKSVHKIMPESSFRCAARNCYKAQKIWPRLDMFRQHCLRIHPDEACDDLVSRSAVNVNFEAGPVAKTRYNVEHEHNSTDPSIQSFCTHSSYLETKIDGPPSESRAGVVRTNERPDMEAVKEALPLTSEGGEPYMHESMDKHAIHRPRGPEERFLTEGQVAIIEFWKGNEVNLKGIEAHEDNKGDQDGETGSGGKLDEHNGEGLVRSLLEKYTTLFK